MATAENGRYVLDHYQLIVHLQEKLIVGSCASSDLEVLVGYKVPRQYQYCERCFSNTPFSRN